MGFNPTFQSKKPVIGYTQADLDKRVNQHLARGWQPVGKVSITHGAYRSEYIQVMQFVGVVHESISNIEIHR